MNAHDHRCPRRRELGLRQWRRLFETTTTIVLLGLAGCHTAEKKSEPLVVRMAVAGLGRLTTPLAATLQTVLPEHFPARIEVQKTANSGAFPQLLESGETDIALIQTDLAYVAY